jgi:hypothetical protein
MMWWLWRFGDDGLCVWRRGVVLCLSLWRPVCAGNWFVVLVRLNARLDRMEAVRDG